ncbi:uncharacterized protein B0T15DRAFT_188770 [Chaetomium strumarium]|uniref:Epidermal growth factor receptor-like transmembrane-juxtamembrane segment domain-containing protein n=1 Tax=Chaetomium strumarium TaxID=1170767 RepID=A0AAJ0GS50_9PEZI|nr:hypothetical protein B0T15DRAFT_188770 [Chaetomium strumarium]
MAVMSLRRLVAVSAWLSAVSAGLQREQPHAPGPVQTPVPDLKDANLLLAPRVLTARPAPRALLQKRDTNTCGYLDGNSRSAYICGHDEAQCLFNTEASAVGCCLTTDCNIYTACLDYSASDRSSTLDMDRTRYCSDSDKPSCAVLRYADPTNSVSGYTIPTCDTVATTRQFYFRSFDTRPNSQTSRSSLVLTTETSAESTSTSASSSSSDITQAATTSDSTNTSTSTPAAASSSTPVGPIVGGVVGGVAGLGLLGLGVFFLLRRKKQDPASPMAPPGGPVYMPPPGQGPYPNQPSPPNMASMPGTPGAFDPRYSMVKPPMATTVSSMQGSHMSPDPMGISPANSPSPVYHTQMHAMAPIPGQMGMGTPSPPPPHHSMGGGTPPPQGHFAPQNGPYVPYPGPQKQEPHFGAAELPTQRGDGQVHELS